MYQKTRCGSHDADLVGDRAAEISGEAAELPLIAPHGPEATRRVVMSPWLIEEYFSGQELQDKRLVGTTLVETIAFQEAPSMATATWCLSLGDSILAIPYSLTVFLLISRVPCRLADDLLFRDSIQASIIKPYDDSTTYLETTDEDMVRAYHQTDSPGGRTGLEDLPHSLGDLALLTTWRGSQYPSGLHTCNLLSLDHVNSNHGYSYKPLVWNLRTLESNLHHLATVATTDSRKSLKRNTIKQ
jgi:hypothetical protein